MSKLIPIDTSIDAMKLIKQLTTIALKAHGNNPSPVDIKTELAELDSDQLIKLNEDVTTSIKERETIYEQRSENSGTEGNQA